MFESFHLFFLCILFMDGQCSRKRKSNNRTKTSKIIINHKTLLLTHAISLKNLLSYTHSYYDFFSFSFSSFIFVWKKNILEIITMNVYCDIFVVKYNYITMLQRSKFSCTTNGKNWSSVQLICDKIPFRMTIFLVNRVRWKKCGEQQYFLFNPIIMLWTFLKDVIGLLTLDTLTAYGHLCIFLVVMVTTDVFALDVRIKKRNGRCTEVICRAVKKIIASVTKTEMMIFNIKIP